MQISKIERPIGPQTMNHIQRVTQEISDDGKFVQTGETLENGTVTFREVIEKGYNYFKRTLQSFTKKGEPIKGSEFTEELTGEAANKKQVRHFGVIG